MTYQIDAEKTEYLGIPELQVIKIDEDDPSVFHVTKKPCEVECPECHDKAYNQRGYKVRKIRDIVLGDNAPRHITIAYHQRVYVCSFPDCGITFTDSCDFVGQGRKITFRYERYLFELMKLKTISAVAAEEGLSKETVSRIFNTYHSPRLFWWIYEPKIPNTIGIFSFPVEKDTFVALCNFEDMALITLLVGKSPQEFYQDKDDISELMAILNTGVRRIIIEPDCPNIGSIRAAFPKAKIAVNALSLGALIKQHLFDLAQNSLSRYKYLKFHDILAKSGDELTQYDLNFIQRSLSSCDRLDTAYKIWQSYQSLTDSTDPDHRGTETEWLKRTLSKNKLIADEIMDVAEIAFEYCGYVGIGLYSSLLSKIAELARETHGCKTGALYERILMTGKTRYRCADGNGHTGTVQIPTGTRPGRFTIDCIGRDLSDIVQTLEYYNKVYSGEDFIHELH